MTEDYINMWLGVHSVIGRGIVITVLLVDDHPVFLETLLSLFSGVSDIQVVATALNGAEAIVQAQLFCPDVIVMDVSMPVMAGIEATTQIRLHCPSCRVIMLSMYYSPEYVQRALQAGATGYVLKGVVASDLQAIIRAVYEGNQYFSQRIAGTVEQYRRQSGKDNSLSKPE